MVSLLPYNTFGIDVAAQQVIEIKTTDDLLQVIKKDPDSPKLILGGGSNMLFRRDIDETVLINRIMGKELISKTNDSVTIAVGGGENWHELVLWSLQQGWYGLENLSLIPGTVGAAPIQNIGAYGVELKDYFAGLEAIDLTTGVSIFFDKSAMQFGYRDSLFKREWKGKALISKVYFKLSLTPNINISYGVIPKVLEAAGVDHPSPVDVSNAVVFIRKSKLPDPAVLGNAGSFFKNPELDAVYVEEKLLPQFPKMPQYPSEPGKIKVPAGWLIDQCGWKGQKLGSAGCYEKQALVLVNHGGASGSDVWKLAEAIQASVFSKFGVSLEPEVNLY
jgi:UDP-N-acetylmuramate dehydrogenase